METCFNYTGKEMFVSSDERKIINRVLKIKQDFPESVSILSYPKDNDGCIYAKMPASWLWIKPPRKYSKDKLDALKERGKKLASIRTEKQFDI